MSSNLPATVSYSLEEFSRHGGLTGPHKDGWGIAYYVDRDVRLVKEPLPASDSACVRFIRENPFTSSLVISHIRKATRGAHTLSNCQPFVREMGGAMHVFAHNGDLDDRRLKQRLRPGFHRPVGDTDSEYAFCALLGRLEQLWLGARKIPAFSERTSVVARFAEELRALGPANFLYSDGDVQFVHGHQRTHANLGLRPPGLHVICRRCARGPGAVGSLSTDGLTIRSTDGEQRVVLVASVPLTTEPGWRGLGEGELIAVRDGAILE